MNDMPERFEDPRDPEFRDDAPREEKPPAPGQALTITQKARQDLRKLEPQFAALLPEGFPLAKFTQVVMTAVLSNKDVLAADRDSLFSACLKSAQDGLLPDGREAALVVFRQKNGPPKVQYMPMIWGITKKMHQTGDLGTLITGVVFEKDVFKQWTDETGEHIKHEPESFKDRGAPVGAYAMVITKDRFTYIESMSKEEIHDVRDVSKAKEFGPWSGAFAGEMWKKTVLRRLSKRVPMSAELERVIRREDELFDFGRSDPRKSGLAGELNGPEQNTENPQGDKIESLSDLRISGDRSMPHQNLGGDADRCGMESSIDVPETPHGAARGARSVPGEIHSLSVEDRGEGLGGSEVPRQTSPAPSTLEGSTRRGAKPGPKPKGEKRW